MPTEIEWALVADAQHARVLERKRPAGAWTEHTGMAIEIRNPPSRDRGTDRPGRVRESAGTARHAMEPRSDPHRQAKQEFAESLARQMETAAQAGRFHALVLVAPPAFLGDLRDGLGDAARRLLRGSLDKDLTKHPLAEIVPHLDDIRPAEA